MLKTKRNKILNILFILLMTLIFCLSYLSSTISVIPEQDLTFHLNRIVGIANALEEGQILPKIYPYANFGFGYATSLFYCDIFLCPFAILYHFGMPVVIAYKLCIFSYTLLGTILMYMAMNRIFKNDKIAIISSILYLFANYHIQNVYIRSALGEILAMSFIPLVLLAFYEILIERKDSYKLLGISFSLLVMSHLISSLLYGLLFFIFIIIIIILNRKDLDRIKRMLITIIKGTLLAILLCAWYLLPMFEQMHDQEFWLNANQQYNNLQAGKQSLFDIFKPLAISNINQFDITREANIGIVYILLTFIYIFVKKNRYINVLLVLILLIYLIIVGIIPAISLLNVIQFLFRFYIILFPLFTIIISYNLGHINIKYTNIIGIAIFLFSIFNIINTNNFLSTSKYKLDNYATIEDVNNINASEDDSLDYNRDELGGAEYLPYTVNMNYKTENNSIKTIDNNGNKVDYAWEYERNFTTIVYNYNDDEDRELLFPLSYYKGYKAYEIIDDKLNPIPVYNYDIYKLVSINVKAGEHTYLITYEGTIIQSISLFVSSITLVIFIIYEIIGKIKNKGETWIK